MHLVIFSENSVDARCKTDISSGLDWPKVAQSGAIKEQTEASLKLRVQLERGAVTILPLIWPTNQSEADNKQMEQIGTAKVRSFGLGAPSWCQLTFSLLEFGSEGAKWSERTRGGNKQKTCWIYR